MIITLKKLLSKKSVPPRDFSSFFTDATQTEKERLLQEVIQQANKDQQDLMKTYTRAH